MLSVGGKFALLLYLAEYTSLETLGTYGLFVVTAHIALHLLGLEFFTYATRELIASPGDRRGGVLRNQAVVYALAYLIFLPPLCAVFVGGFLPWRLAPYFFWVVVANHVTQEAQRILIALKRPLAAYVCGSITHGLWSFVVIGAGLVDASFRSLEVVLTVWAMFGTIGGAAALVTLRRVLGSDIASQGPVDWTWIRAGLRLSAAYFVSSLAYKSITLSDRYFIEHHLGTSAVGTYTFMSSIAHVFEDLLVTTIVAASFPAVVEAAANRQPTEYRLALADLWRKVAWGVVVVLPAFVVGIFVLLAIVNKTQLDDALAVYFVALGSSVMVSLSLPAHYALYARKRDRTIILATVAAALANLGLNALLVPFYGLMGAAAATALSLLAVTLVKIVAATRLEPLA